MWNHLFNHVQTLHYSLSLDIYMTLKGGSVVGIKESHIWCRMTFAFKCRSQPSKKNCFGSTSTCQHVLKWQDKYVSEDGQHLTPKTLCNQNNNLNRAQNLYNVIKKKCGFWSCSLCVCVSRIHHLTILALSFGLCHHSLLLSFFPNVSMASSFFLVMKCRLLCIHRRWNIYMS